MTTDYFVPEVARPPPAGEPLLRPGGLVRLPTILKLIPVGKSSIWEMVRRRDFPRPVKLSARVTAWRTDDVIDFINSRKP